MKVIRILGRGDSHFGLLADLFQERPFDFVFLSGTYITTIISETELSPS